MDRKSTILAATLFCFVVAVLFKSGPTRQTGDDGVLSKIFQGAIVLVLAVAMYWIYLHWSSLMQW